jgi:effector-binding domain-containing protein
MSYNTEAYDMDLNKLENFIDRNGDIEIYPRYIIEWMEAVESDTGSGFSFPRVDEEWWSADRTDALWDRINDWGDNLKIFNTTIYIDVYYQESEDTVRDYISRVYQHKSFTVEDIVDIEKHYLSPDLT